MSNHERFWISWAIITLSIVSAVESMNIRAIKFRINALEHSRATASPDPQTKGEPKP
jgi:hypothetical protein